MVISEYYNSPYVHVHPHVKPTFVDGLRQEPFPEELKVPPQRSVSPPLPTIPEDRPNATMEVEPTIPSPKPQESKSWTDGDFYIYNEQHSYFFETDLPGVKADNISVEYSNDNTILVLAHRDTKNSIFTRFLSLDKYSLDPSSFQATLSDGVLTLQARKTQDFPSRVHIGVEPAPPELDAPEDGEFYLELDIPGAKQEDVSVVLSRDKNELAVTANRQGGRLPVQQYYRISNKVDISKIRAYLSDGVLYIQAPPKYFLKRRIVVQAQGKSKTKGGSSSEWFHRGFLKTRQPVKTQEDPKEDPETEKTAPTSEWFHPGFLNQHKQGVNAKKREHPKERVAKKKRTTVKHSSSDWFRPGFLKVPEKNHSGAPCA